MKEYIKGGMAAGRDKNFSPVQIRKGIKVEMEHTHNPKVAREIAKDHLMEDPKYYNHLHQMEKKYERKSRIYVRRADTNRLKPGEFSPDQAVLVTYFGSRRKAKRLKIPLFRHNGKLWQGG